MKSIDCALRKTSGGAGLHPSQIQLGVKAAPNSKLATSSGHMEPNEIETRCKDLLRKNHVGIVTLSHAPISDLKSLAFDTYDKALNPGEKPRGTPGQPLQVPSRYT
jgi:hypothetical protein